MMAFVTVVIGIASNSPIRLWLLLIESPSQRRHPLARLLRLLLKKAR